MASFTVRIVLHDADWSDYAKLYDEMEKHGFSDVITSNDGVKYKLPDGEYNILGELTCAEVLAKAKAASAKSNKKYAALITKSASRTWTGLEKI